MTTIEKLLRPVGALSVFALAAAVSVSASAAGDAPQFDIQNKPDFVKSLGLDASKAAPALTSEQTKKALTGIYNDKLEQHVTSLHFQKGVTCVSCHDQQRQGGPDWMAKITNPPMKKTCQDCHETQAYVVSKTDSHRDIDCVACHMPNAKMGVAIGPMEKFDAVRRLHTYKIEVSPKATTWSKDNNGNWSLAKNEDGHGYVDLMWSCARTAPADWTTFGVGKGCHSIYTSKLEKGLQYADQEAVYGEVLKWQTPVKEGFKAIRGGVSHMTKLLEVTPLEPADQTEIRMLLDKAGEIADLIEKDGSWGAHANHFLQNRVKTAQSYLAKAQKMLDAGGYAQKK